MNTKVKGEVIKEGSIPLSALSNEIKDKLNNIFIMPDDFIEEQYDEPDEIGCIGKVKQIYVTDILENKYTKISMYEILGDIIIKDEYIKITFEICDYSTETKQESYTEFYIRIHDCKVINNIYINNSPFVRDGFSSDPYNVGDIRYRFVKSVTDEEITIPEENKQLFKKSMGSFADWNAKEGEAGYIENKPFGKLKVNGEIFDVSQNPLIRNIHYFIPYDLSIIEFEPSKKIDYIRVYWEEYDAVFIDETIEIPNDTTSVQTIKHVSETPLGNFNLDFEKTTSEIRVYLSAQDELFSVSAESILERIVVEAITYLSDEYLPDTILKTTPQTLSDTGKNQALANLGIDPVVWKYMMNPYHLPSSRIGTIPNDLRSVIFDGNDKLKDIVLKLVVFEINDDSGDNAAIYSAANIAGDGISVRVSNGSEYGIIIYPDGHITDW